jgi:hypothetical protein
MTRNEYLKRRGEFVPEDPKDIKLIIVAESPPASELYFYKADGSVKEPLFAAVMKQLDFKGSKKLDGLQHFKQCGWVLVDATYEPVDRETDSVRDAIIKRDYELFCCDLRSLTPDRSARLVLIKKNVCQILEPMLHRDKFKGAQSRHCDPFSLQWLAESELKSDEFSSVFLRPLSFGDGRRPIAL